MNQTLSGLDCTLKRPSSRAAHLRSGARAPSGVLAPVLGLVHARVRLGQQRARVLEAAPVGHHLTVAEAELQAGLLPGCRDGLVQTLAQLVGSDVVGLGDDAELVAPEPRDEVGL